MLFKHIFTLPLLFKNLLPIKTEKSIILNSYLGKWNQVATSRSTSLFGTGPGYRNVSALYNITNGTLLSVYNSGYNQKKEFTSISGYSYTEGESQTKRKLHFDTVPVDGNYWIVKLGPIKNNEYQYAIISGAIRNYFGTRFSLYVLARNIKEYQLYYEEQVKLWCKKNLFIFYWNEYIQTYK